MPSVVCLLGLTASQEQLPYAEARQTEPDTAVSGRGHHIGFDGTESVWNAEGDIAVFLGAQAGDPENEAILLAGQGNPAVGHASQVEQCALCE